MQKVPTMGPAMEQLPPSRDMAMNITEVFFMKVSGLMKPTSAPYSPPAKAQ